MFLAQPTAHKQSSARGVIDGSTGSASNRHLGPALEEAARQAGGQRTPLSLVVLDIDHLKAYNEAFGHRSGDEVLRMVLDLLRANLAAVELVTRLGGEEFAVVLPSSDAPSALQTAERLRRAIEANDWPFRPVTASFGVATQPTGGAEFAALIDRADRALRHSKRRGCNRVSHADTTAVVAS